MGCGCQDRRQTESNAYEPTVQIAHVGSKIQGKTGMQIWYKEGFTHVKHNLFFV